MGSPARLLGPRAAAAALACSLVVAGLGAEARADAANHLLRLDSIKPVPGGFEVAMQVGEDELATLGLREIDNYLRTHRPRLFSGISLGLVRYRNARILPQELELAARAETANILDVDVRADVVVDQQERELVCELVGWKTRCESRWIDRGTAVIATVDASGELRLSLRPGAALTERPISIDVYLRAIRGSLRLAALRGVGLEIGFDPPYRAETVEVGIPEGAIARLRRFGDLLIRDMRVAAAPERHIAIAATIARP